MHTDTNPEPFPSDPDAFNEELFETRYNNAIASCEHIIKRIALKGFKHAAFASHETLCYTATIYLDGRKVGDVHNDGNGGDSCLYFADWQVERDLADQVKQAFEQFDGEVVPIGLSGIIDHIADEVVTDKKIAAFTKKCFKRGFTVILCEGDLITGCHPTAVARTMNELAASGEKVKRILTPPSVSRTGGEA